MIEIFLKVPKFNLCPFQKAAEKRKPDPDDERELRKKLMQVQIEYFERKTVLTNLMILRENNIPVLQINNVDENQNSNKTILQSRFLSVDTDEIMLG